VLDHILSDEQASKEGSYIAATGIELVDDDAGDWMSRLLESELLTRPLLTRCPVFFFASSNPP
jgi:hypothetical protein